MSWGFSLTVLSTKSNCSRLSSSRLWYHQEEINWKKISPKKFQFEKRLKAVIIKIQNFKKTGTRTWISCRGLSFLSSMSWTQAENFIATVPKKIDALLSISNMIATVLMHTPKNNRNRHYAWPLKTALWQTTYISKTFYHIVLIGNFPNTRLEIMKENLNWKTKENGSA